MHAHVGPSFGCEGDQMWRKVSGTCVSVFFFSPISTGAEGERPTPCCQTISELRDVGQSFDDALETPLWARVLPECF